MELEGFGSKSVYNLMQAIEKSKQNSLEKLLFALGIRYVGSKNAKILASYFQNMDALIDASYETLVGIRDIGEIIAKSVYEYFRNDTNLYIIKQLKDCKVNMEYLGKVVVDASFASKTFVLTGTLSKITREKAKEEIESRGGKTSSSVSKKTDVVIVGKDPGSKYDKALELHLTIWNEDAFLEKL